MTWRIEIGTGTDRVLLGEILTAQSAWGRLTKSGQKAVRAAYPDGIVRAGVPTIRSLYSHGFITREGELTEAAKAIAKWMCKP